MKKLATIGFILALALPISAPAYYTTIENADSQLVRDAIARAASQSSTPFRVESSNEYGISLVSNGAILGGPLGLTPIAVEYTCSFTIADLSNGVGVNCSIVEKRSTANGYSFAQPASPLAEADMLASIKSKFDGVYSFGFDMDPGKVSGGHTILLITPGLPMQKAGIEVGDIILKINGKKVPVDKSTKTIDRIKLGQNRLVQQSWTFEILKRDGTKRTYEITSQLLTPDELKAIPQ